ncbi:MAG TPA: cytochrome c554 family protein [Desulfobacteraceae bacterium]|nr:cytochrome c554 family protein [Desulfobacteraceae bacterium]
MIRKPLVAALTLSVIWTAGMAAAAEKAAPEQTFGVNRFISPDTCGGCHSEIQSQWANSMHNLSHKDPVYNRVAAFLRQGLTDAGEIQEAESCVKCHTPVGYVTGFPKKLSDDLSAVPEIAVQGIQCDLCHTAVDVTKMYNNGLVLSPGQGEDDPGVKYGPFDDSEPDFHEAAYSKLHTESGICGPCHNVKHVAFGTDLETTYTEWEKSPYNDADPEKRVNCQGCHMRQRPGVPATGSTERPDNPGAATDYSDERPHIFTHYFVGGNSGVPGDFGDVEKPAMAQERLKHAAELALDVSGIAGGKAGVTVTNSGAGHCLPTGVGDLRQVWIELTLTGADGKILYGSGIPGPDGVLPEDTVIFNTVFGDGHGKAVPNLAKAREILSDSRIKPKETAVRTFDLGISPERGQTLRARLLYRGMPQKILNMVPGEKLGPLPVVEMARVSHIF